MAKGKQELGATEWAILEHPESNWLSLGFRRGQSIVAGVTNATTPFFERTVAVLDILGFRELNSRLSPPRVVFLTHTLLEFLRRMIFDEPSVSICRASDTIVLASSSEDSDGLAKVCKTANTYLAVSHAIGIPMRGAITFGTAHVEPRLGSFVGPAVIRAYEMEQEQQWGGARVDPRLLKDSKTAGQVENELASHRIVEADIPLKGLPQRLGLALNWPGIYLGKTFDVEAHLATWLEPKGQAAEKIRNTATFFHNRKAFASGGDVCLPLGDGGGPRVVDLLAGLLEEGATGIGRYGKRFYKTDSV